MEEDRREREREREREKARENKREREGAGERLLVWIKAERSPSRFSQNILY